MRLRIVLKTAGRLTNMTTIYLKEDAKIEIDGYNHTLMKFIPGGEKKMMKGQPIVTKPRWDILGYYPNIE